MTSQDQTAQPSPDRDTNGAIRLELIEDKDPRSGATWHSFQIMSSIRLSEKDHAALKAAFDAGQRASALAALRASGAPDHFLALYEAVDPPRGTGGVPNLLLMTDYGAAVQLGRPGRCTIHTEVFLIASDSDDIAALRQLIGRRDLNNTMALLTKTAIVTDSETLRGLLVACGFKP